METLKHLTSEARMFLAVLITSVVGLSVALVITGDQMDNLARLVFVVMVAVSSLMASVVLMSEAHNIDLNTLTRSSVARIKAMNDKHREEVRARMSELFATTDALYEARTERDTYRRALETVTRDAHKSRTTGEAFDLASYLVDYRTAQHPNYLAFGGMFTGNEYAYGTWDEYDARIIARAVAEWNDAVMEHPTR